MNRALEIFDELKAFHKEKNKEYSIVDHQGKPDPLGNLRASRRMGVDPVIGVFLTLENKFVRLESLVRNNDLHGEGVRKMLTALAIYSILALVLLEENNT